MRMHINRGYEQLQIKADKLIRIGQKVTVKTVRCNGNDYGQESKYNRRNAVGTVVDKDKYKVLVDFGKYKETFRYNQIFGNEETGVTMK